MGVIHTDVRKLNKERKMQQRAPQGNVDGIGGAVVLILAGMGAFWLCAGIGIGWLIWH